MVVAYKHAQNIALFVQGVKLAVVDVRNGGRLLQHVAGTAGVAQLVEFVFMGAEGLDGAFLAFFHPSQHMVILRHGNVLEYQRGHIVAGFCLQCVPGLAIPVDNGRIKGLIPAALGVGAGVEQVQVHHRAPGAVRGGQGHCVGAAAGNALCLLSDTAGQGFVNVVKLVRVADAHLPIVVAKGNGKGNVAPGHRLQQGGNGLGHSGLQLFFGLALVGHAVALDLVAGVDDQIRVLRLHRRVQQCQGVR